MNESAEWVEVVRLAARGDGVTAEGRFIAGAVPGDLAGPGGAIRPGPDHVAPACRHFGTCGGCQLQHASDRALAAFARARCLEPLARLGIVPERVAEVALSPPGSRRRAALRAMRAGQAVVLGFSREGSHALVDVDQCPVLRPDLFALLAPLRRLLSGRIPARGTVGVTLTATDSGVDLLLSNLAAERLEAVEALTAFAAAQRLSRLSVEGPQGVETVVAPALPVVTLGGVAVTLPPAAFLQATAQGEAALVAAVHEGVAGAGRVADLFAGLGTFALPLARQARVLAVDAAGPAILALQQAARATARPVETQHRDLFRRPLSADELRGFDAVVFDPPRSGAAAQATEIAVSGVPVVMAVSCNPATFARDAECLVAGGYRLVALWPVAQFRWSTHVELAAEFRLA